MKYLKKSIIALSLTSIFFLTGCATSADDEDCCTSLAAEKALRKNPDIYNKLSRDKADRISRELTMSFYNDERRSAAVEEGGFKHTLGMNNPLYKSDEYPANVRYDLSKRYQGQNSGLTSSSNVPVRDVFNPGKQSSDYSYYELGRWQRLCDGTNGRNMDRLDWRFVRNHKNEFPMDLLDTCRLPSSDNLARHGIRGGSEYSRKPVKSIAVRDDLPNSVYPYLMKDHEPANTPLVIKEPTFTEDDDSIVVYSLPDYDATQPKAAKAKQPTASKNKVRPYAKSSVATNNSSKQPQSDLDWLEKEIN
ncbi:hypothetical protein [Succinivibrio dextrinosolvens]|uniref:hypothetical protein n=1 Tax=Succinivibrio dextrinosolvens TaxID=83771 RepID=UPI00241E06C0|nr:hypothetical protein [Succinivibrio dextrinosolvens]MBE6423079.1 hypothetical protein [Succinivibrio dextrinosolvens]